MSFVFAKSGGCVAHEELKRRVLEEIDRNADHLIAVGERIYRDPGTRDSRSFGRRRSSRPSSIGSVSDTMKKSPSPASKRWSAVARPGRRSLCIGELDSVLVADHEFANPETGAAHCCGHNAQIDDDARRRQRPGPFWRASTNWPATSPSLPCRPRSTSRSTTVPSSGARVRPSSWAARAR